MYIHLVEVFDPIDSGIHHWTIESRNDKRVVHTYDQTTPTFHQDGIHCLGDKTTRQEYHAWCEKVRNTYESYAKYNEQRWPKFYQAVNADWKEDQQIVKERDASDADKAAELAKIDGGYRATLEDYPLLGTSVEDDPGATYESDTEED